MTPAPRTINATWTLASPAAPGAVAIIQLHGDIDAALASCAIPRTATGHVRLRDLLGIDRGIVARFAPDMCQLMPHGGVAIVRAILAELTRRGIPEATSATPAAYPEARSEVEAKALATLALAASPLAVDLLLAQHALWSQPGAASDPERDRILRRLIDPPLVVAVGASNIGKSTLVNALAGRSVSIVADEPGTTRDHVGVMLDLAGLVVRYVDTPGLRTGASDLEQAAVTSAMDLAADADLLLLCGDPTSPPPPLPAALKTKPRRTVHLRADLGKAATKPDAQVSVERNEGLADLVTTIREALVPTEHWRAQTPWRFW